jgi:hypothetical protein
MGVGLGALAMAQQPAASPFQVDSAEVYIAFFRFQDDFSNWLDQRKANVTAQAAQGLDTATAAHFSVDPADLGKLRGVTTSVMANFKNIDRDMFAYVTGRVQHELLPESGVMDQFAKRRAQAALDGAAQLQQVLSSNSWSGIHNYINNIHRLRYHLGSTNK